VLGVQRDFLSCLISLQNP